MGQVVMDGFIIPKGCTVCVPIFGFAGKDTGMLNPDRFLKGEDGGLFFCKFFGLGIGGMFGSKACNVGDLYCKKRFMVIVKPEVDG